jgi:hypothetical protein
MKSFTTPWALHSITSTHRLVPNPSSATARCTLSFSEKPPDCQFPSLSSSAVPGLHQDGVYYRVWRSLSHLWTDFGEEEYTHYRFLHPQITVDKVDRVRSAEEKMALKVDLREAIEPLMATLGMEPDLECSECSGRPHHPSLRQSTISKS